MRPPNLAKLVARRETETEAERDEYTYRQTVTIQELDGRGVPAASTARSATSSSRPPGAHRAVGRQAQKQTEQRQA